MRKSTWNIKNVLNSILILSAALISHGIACGTFISIAPFVITALLVVLYITSTNSTTISNKKLIFLIVSTQLISHYLLGNSILTLSAPNCGMGSTSMTVNSANMSGWHMAIAHALASVASYFFIRKNEGFWNFFGFAKLKILITTYNPIINVKGAIQFNPLMYIFEFVQNLNLFLVSATSRLSAPPQYL